MLRTGLERILAGEYPELHDLKLGLVINQTSVNGELQLSLDLMLVQGFNIKAVFAPEHGLRGDTKAGEQIGHFFDTETGIPVYSLYGKDKRPSAEMLQGLDALIFDIQDLGVRFYTYIYTLAYTMEEASRYGLTYYVLDRPNAITGTKVEGNVIEEDFQSFVGGYGLPIRHGMTVGELARYFNQEYDIGCRLQVIPMEGWQREQWYDQTNLLWVMPSPNTTAMDMSVLYPGTCLFEGTNVSEGRGTTKPFELIGAPWINGKEWAERIRNYNLNGFILRPVHFIPVMSKYQGEKCQGVQIHVTDRDQLEPVKLGMAMIESLKALYPDNFEWAEPINGRYFIDLLTGTDQFRHYIDLKRSILDWSAEKETELKAFNKKRDKYLIYK